MYTTTIVYYNHILLRQQLSMDLPGNFASTHPHLVRDAAHLGRSLRNLLELTRARERELAEEWGLPPSQCRALVSLGVDGPVTVTGLAERLFLEKSSASRLVKGLGERGFARKRPTSSDERKVVVQLTESGARLHRKIQNELAQTYVHMAQALKPEMRKALPDLLDLLAAEMKGRLRGDGDDSH